MEMLNYSHDVRRIPAAGSNNRRQRLRTPNGKTIWAMGVAGEAGEVVEKWKKIVAYKGGKVSDEDLGELSKRTGRRSMVHRCYGPQPGPIV